MIRFPGLVECSPFDLDAGEFLGSLIACVDYDARRVLMARSGGAGGSSGSRRGRGRAGGPRIRIGAFIRGNVRKAETRVRRTSAAAEQARATAAYYKRIAQRSREQTSRFEQLAREHGALARQIEKVDREARKAAARERRLAVHFFTPAKSRSRYQRRVVSGATRQFERGERPTLPQRKRRTQDGGQGRGPGGGRGDRRQHYAAMLQREYGEHRYSGIADHFLNKTTTTRQTEIIEEAMELNRQWKAHNAKNFAEGKEPENLGMRFDVFIAYHFTDL